MQIASQPMTWKHQSINKQNYNHKQINKSKKVRTLLDTNCPTGSNRIVTEPLSASSKTVAYPVVLIGTPCLLSYANKVLDIRSWNIQICSRIMFQIKRQFQPSHLSNFQPYRLISLFCDKGHPITLYLPNLEPNRFKYHASQQGTSRDKLNLHIYQTCNHIS